MDFDKERGGGEREREKIKLSFRPEQVVILVGLTSGQTDFDHLHFLWGVGLVEKKGISPRLKLILVLINTMPLSNVTVEVLRTELQ